MLPSMYARPGHRLHPLECAQVEQTGRSRVRIERTSSSCGEYFQMSINFCWRVAAGQRKLHAWIDVAVRRDVAGAMSRAARNVVHVVVVGSWSDRDELVFGLAGDTLVVHYVAQVFARDVQREQ